VAGCWWLVVGGWLLVAGCWWLVVGGWLLVAGCWLLREEVVRAALRSLEHEEHQYKAKLAALRAAIDEGDASGINKGARRNSGFSHPATSACFPKDTPSTMTTTNRR